MPQRPLDYNYFVSIQLSPSQRTHSPPHTATKNTFTKYRNGIWSVEAYGWRSTSYSIRPCHSSLGTAFLIALAISSSGWDSLVRQIYGKFEIYFYWRIILQTPGPSSGALCRQNILITPFKFGLILELSASPQLMVQIERFRYTSWFAKTFASWFNCATLFISFIHGNTTSDHW